MSDSDSLCSVHWKLGQALMPSHFLLQERAVVSEFRRRLEHQPRPAWGVADLAYSEDALTRQGLLIIERLQLVMQDGSLVDIPGNAKSVNLKLPEAAEAPVDVYLQVSERGPEIFATQANDQDGGRVELSRLQLELVARSSYEQGQGFRLARFHHAPVVDDGGPGLPKRAAGWSLDPSFAPPMLKFGAVAGFGFHVTNRLKSLLTAWRKLVADKAYDEWLAVNKRVEAQLYWRSAHQFAWYLEQVGLTRMEGYSAAKSTQQGPRLEVHPFDVFDKLVGLYLDAFAFRASPSEVQANVEPDLVDYRHDELAECFDELISTTAKLLKRPPARAAEQPFKHGPAGAMQCNLPSHLDEDSEVYLLVQFKGPPPPRPDEDDRGNDRRLAGLRLGAPEQLGFMGKHVMPGVGLERVRQLRFAHDFDTSAVQFYRVLPGDAWREALKVQRIAYYPGERPIEKSSMFWPTAAERRDDGAGSRP